MYLRKYKISKAAFLQNTSQQPSLYIIWFRVSPNQKYYFMSQLHLKSSQKSKIKLLVNVVNASRDLFRTIFSIQNVFRTTKMALFTKTTNGWKPLTFSTKSFILDIFLGPENASGFTVFNYFHQKLHLRSLRGQIYLCMYLVPQIWRWINEISKILMLWRNTLECAVSENNCSKNFVNFQGKNPGEIAFLNKVAGYQTLMGMFFWEIYEIFRTGFTRNTCKCQFLHWVVAGNCFDQKIFFKKYLIRFDIQWHVLPGIKCITEVSRPFTMSVLVCIWCVRFNSLRDFLIWENVYVMSIATITHTVHFSNQEVLWRRAARGSSSKSECSWNDGKKKNLS